MYIPPSKPDLLTSTGYSKKYSKKSNEMYNKRIHFVKATEGNHALKINEVVIGLYACANYEIQGYAVCVVCIEEICKERGIDKKKYWIVDETYDYESLNFNQIREKITYLNNIFNVIRINTNSQILEVVCKDIINEICYIDMNNDELQNNSLVTAFGLINANKLNVVYSLQESFLNNLRIEKCNINLRANAMFLALFNYRFEEVMRNI